MFITPPRPDSLVTRLVVRTRISEARRSRAERVLSVTETRNHAQFIKSHSWLDPNNRQRQPARHSPSPKRRRQQPERAPLPERISSPTAPNNLRCQSCPKVTRHSVADNRINGAKAGKSWQNRNAPQSHAVADNRPQASQTIVCPAAARHRPSIGAC